MQIIIDFHKIINHPTFMIGIFKNEDVNKLFLINLQL